MPIIFTFFNTRDLYS